MQQEKKKKKGRPSLLDLQKRFLKQQRQQQEQQDPNSFNLSSKHCRRSTGRSPNPDQPASISGEDDDERKEIKHKLLYGLDPHPQYPTLSPNSLPRSFNPYGSESNANIQDSEAARKRRKISPLHHGSDAMSEKVSKATDTIHVSQVETGPTTTLPDKKLLVFILDRLQKKDTHGAFSEPVDPEELPDYHDIIENPMDFGTLRKKLDGGAYANLEQFEIPRVKIDEIIAIESGDRISMFSMEDVFLICANAMQYNAPDTIFFRQARSMQELAKKDFENLRQESDDNEPQPKVVRRGRPPGKNVRKSLGSSPLEHVSPEPSTDATFASGGDNARGSNAYNLRKGLASYRSPPYDALVRASHGSHNSENGTNWWSEWENEFPASVLRSVMKYGKKQLPIDENRRDTYKNAVDSDHGPPVLATLEGEAKQLMAVGLHLEHGYAKSLTQFAADLGPIVGKIVLKKIGGVYPMGLKFGPGGMGEKEALKQEQLFLTEEKSLDSSMADVDKSKLLCGGTSESNTAFANRFLLQGQEGLESTRLDSAFKLPSLNSNIGGLKPVSPFRIHQKSIVCSDMNGLNGGFRSDCLSQSRMVRLASLTGMSGSDDTSVPSQALAINSSGHSAIYQMPTNDVERNEAGFPEIAGTHSEDSLALGSGLTSYGASEVMVGREESWQRVLMHHSCPSDVNARFPQTISHSPNVQIGSPQQPDLALQL